MIGDHCIKTWSNTQDTIALSSGEAEYYRIVRGAAEKVLGRPMSQELFRAYIKSGKKVNS